MNWHRQEFDASRTDYTPDDDHFIRVGIDHAPDFSDTYDHQAYQERQLQLKAGYKRVTLRRNTYHGRSGSRWEYTWTAAKDTAFPGPRHAIEETYTAPDGDEYAVSMSAPESDWKAMRRQFDYVLGSWVEPVS